MLSITMTTVHQLLEELEMWKRRIYFFFISFWNLIMTNAFDIHGHHDNHFSFKSTRHCHRIRIQIFYNTSGSHFLCSLAPLSRAIQADLRLVCSDSVLQTHFLLHITKMRHTHFQLRWAELRSWFFLFFLSFEVFDDDSITRSVRRIKLRWKKNAQSKLCFPYKRLWLLPFVR